MHLLAMKTVRPSLTECRVAAKTAEEEEQFVRDWRRWSPTWSWWRPAPTAPRPWRADILSTATSAQAPLLKAAWMKPGSFYSHVGSWEDEYAVARRCQRSSATTGRQ